MQVEQETHVKSAVLFKDTLNLNYKAYKSKAFIKYTQDICDIY